MPAITYDNPAAEIQDIRIAAVSGDPLRHGATYEVADDVAAVLLRRPEWSAAAGDAIADDDNEIAAYGTDRIIQIPGIGDAIAARLVEFAKDK